MKKFLKNARGATAIEFAIIAPVFFLLFVGIVEIGLTMFYDSSLNTGIRAVGRDGVPTGYSSMSQIEDTLNRHLGGLYNKSRSKVVILTYDNFDSAAFTADRRAFVASPAGFFASKSSNSAVPADQSGKIILYGVQYEWGGITQLLDPFIPKYLYSFSIVRNEEF